jgi:epoxide hydrolase 4
MRNIKDLKLGGIHRLTVPILMLWGEQDKFLGKELTYRAHDYCDDLKTVYDSKSGHWIQLDNPELVNIKLVEFFGK